MARSVIKREQFPLTVYSDYIVNNTANDIPLKESGQYLLIGGHVSENANAKGFQILWYVDSSPNPKGRIYDVLTPTGYTITLDLTNKKITLNSNTWIQFSMIKISSKT